MSISEFNDFSMSNWSIIQWFFHDFLISTNFKTFSCYSMIFPWSWNRSEFQWFSRAVGTLHVMAKLNYFYFFNCFNKLLSNILNTKSQIYKVLLNKPLENIQKYTEWGILDTDFYLEKFIQLLLIIFCFDPMCIMYIWWRFINICHFRTILQNMFIQSVINQMEELLLSIPLGTKLTPKLYNSCINAYQFPAVSYHPPDNGSPTW